MLHILSAEGTDALLRLAASDPLLAFDYDGTISPIVADHELAGMRGDTRRLLQTLCTEYKCVVITGRARDDVLRRVDGIGFVEAVGNHGIEPSVRAGHFADIAQSWLPHLSDALHGIAGVELENKKYSYSVHFRRAPDRRQALHSIMAAVKSVGREMHFIPGKAVLNIVPMDAPLKGVALAALMRKFGASTALFAGDDATDEDAFVAAPESVLTLRIGKSERTAARFYTRSQKEIDAVLSLLVSARRGNQGVTPAKESQHA